MDAEPSQRLTDAEMAARVEENLYSLGRAMAQALGGEFEERDDMLRYVSWPGSPIFKGVFRANLAHEQVDDAIEETIAWFKARKAPFFF